MADVCRLQVAPGCAWSAHGEKHEPFPGMHRDHTRWGNPALYLPTVDIQGLETETARNPDRICIASLMKREYLRDVGTVIGWDNGEDATLSFVECAGGTVARAFHGRPMHVQNKKTSKGGWKP